MSAFTKVLVANRGEIACRVMETAKGLGYDTVAVFSEADRHARHVELADEAVCIGAPAVSESYLNQAKILDAIRLCGAEAVHPGYGFLSENVAFAKALEDAGVRFIGPPAAAMELMGSKRASKLAMLEAGVPCVPGYQGGEQELSVLVAESRKIGFPVMVKASAGGGGRGMRLVEVETELEEAIERARSEASHAFGNGELIIEKAVIRPRHVEIQVFADVHGHCVSLGERDCSVQRRHQKVIEESPSPAVNVELRKAMGEAAVRAAQACGYVGAGTVEFLLDSTGAFYFLEMNTRLQVEHPVTEMVTGIDLVEWQFRVAAGEPLPLRQNEVASSGHAIEARLYAEDPANDFLPQTGVLSRFEIPSGAGRRVDQGVSAGTIVTPYYDPMLAKLIAWGADRETARRRLLRMVRDAHVFGVVTNQRFIAQVLQCEEFVKGEASTALIDESFPQDTREALGCLSPLDWVLAAALLRLGSTSKRGRKLPIAFRNSIAQAVQTKISVNDHEELISLNLSEVDGVMTVVGTALGETVRLNISFWDGVNCSYTVNQVTRTVGYQLGDGGVFLKCGQGGTWLSDTTLRPPAAKDGVGSGKLKAPMDGAVVTISVAVGDAVARGQTVAVIEAMKMEHPLKADIDGTVTSVHANLGAQVKGRQLLVEIQS